MARLCLASALCIFGFALATLAQPSPEVQQRISAAIAAAANSTPSNIDYTAFVNPFIGTGKDTISVSPPCRFLPKTS